MATKKKKPTALSRGQEMMRIKMCDLPELAIGHLKYLSAKIGMCMEVCLTVYTVYAQIVEGLPCDDELYIPDADSIRWYKDRGYDYNGKSNSLTNGVADTTCG